MKKFKGQPITGSRPEMSKRAPYVPDAKDTSRDAQYNVKAPPMPFKNNASIAQQPAGTAASGGVSTLEPKIQSGLKRTTPGAKALPSGGPVGQKKPINQAAQIGGKMGFPPPAKKVGGADLKSKFPVKNNAAFFGVRG